MHEPKAINRVTYRWHFESVLGAVAFVGIAAIATVAGSTGSSAIVSLERGSILIGQGGASRQQHDGSAERHSAIAHRLRQRARHSASAIAGASSRGRRGYSQFQRWREAARARESGSGRCWYAR